jgi:hypothetical protein
VGHGLEGIHKLRHDAENAPGILLNESVAVAHGVHSKPVRETKQAGEFQILRLVE